MVTTKLIPAPERADHAGIAPLSPAAQSAMRRLELAFAPRLVVNFDHYGTVWGHSTVAEAESEIAAERAERATVEEWETTDRDGQPLRVVRVVHPRFGTDIRVFTTPAVPVASRYSAGAARYRKLAAESEGLCSAEFDRMLCMVDEMGHCHEQLAKAGRLDLIGGAS